MRRKGGGVVKTEGGELAMEALLCLPLSPSSSLPPPSFPLSPPPPLPTSLTRNPPLPPIDEVAVSLPGNGALDVGRIRGGHGWLCHGKARTCLTTKEGC